MFAFSDNFISGGISFCDIYNDEFIINIRNELNNIQIVDYNYPKYKNTYENYQDVYTKYYKRMPYIFTNKNIDNNHILTNFRLLQYWNYIIQNYDALYDFFDNYEHTFIECCPVELKCEVIEQIIDEYYVLDRFSSEFNYQNTKLFQKIFFYLLIKYI